MSRGPWKRWGRSPRSPRAAAVADRPDLDRLLAVTLAHRDAALVEARGFGLAPASRRAIRNALRRWSVWIVAADLDLHQVTTADLRAFASWLTTDNGLAPSTVAESVLWARASLRALAWAGAGRVNIPRLPRIQNPVPPHLRRIAPRLADLRGALDRLTDAATSKPSLRILTLAAAVLLASEAGLRVGEIADLDWRDVDVRRRSVLVRLTKSGRDREAPISDRLALVLAHLRVIVHPGPDWPVIPTVHGARARRDGPRARSLRTAISERIRTWQEAERLSGHRGAHVLRHAAAMAIAEAAGLEAARDLLGHSSVQTTERTYAHRISAERLRRAQAEAWGRPGPGTNPTG